MWSFFSRDSLKDFNYEIGEPFSGPYNDNSFWKLHAGKRKGTGELVSIFVFDVKNRNETQLDIAKASLKRLKTLRHPNITLYLDSLENDKIVYLVTEYVEPLAHSFTNNDESKQQHELEISWGLHQVAKGLNFLNNDCNLVHNNICIWSIFKNQAGDWKLGGFDYVTTFSKEDVLPIKILPQFEKYDPPEKSDKSLRGRATKWSVDMWGLGCLIWEVFNGTLDKSANLKNIGKIPKSLASNYCVLVSANPASRPNTCDFIRQNRCKGGFFQNNFIDTLLFLEEIQIKESNEKTKFFNDLTARLDSFPPEMCKYKILPQLVTAYEFGNAGSAVLAPMFKLGKLLDAEDYQKKIVPCVVKLFSSNDRATRARLLQQMENFVDYLKPSLINNQIFPQVLQGFMDTNPTIRENTVKAMLYLVPKLNYNNLNVELIKHFARLQARDEQGGIRTNTTICLGKIAQYLHPQVRQKMLVPAFVRAMKDPFPPAKTAGILALAATQVYYPLKEIAYKIIPALSCACIDPDKSVRDQAFKTIKGFLVKLENVSEDPTLAATIESEVNSTTSPTLSDSAASWAGWAVTSLTSKFYKSSKAMPEPTIGSNEATAKTENAKDELRPSTSGSLRQAARSSATVVELKKSKQELTSDSDDDWNDDWGQLDNKSDEISEDLTSTDQGWKDEDWSPMPTEPHDSNVEEVPRKRDEKENAQADSWQQQLFVATDSSLKSASLYNWGEESKQEDSFFDLIVNTNSEMNVTSHSKPMATSGWDDNESWESWDTGESSKSNRSQMEERRRQRQKEIQDKRIARQTFGAMKLGEKKKFAQI